MSVGEMVTNMMGVYLEKLEIRKRIKETKQGYRVTIKISRRNPNTLKNKGNSPEDDMNVM